MNKIMIIGNLTKDVYTATTSGGKQYAKITVAVNRTFGENKAVDFFDVTAWNSLAENCAKYLGKGDKVAVTGSAHIEMYEKDGQTRKNFFINATEIEFLKSRKTEEATTEVTVSAEPKKTIDQLKVIDDDDFPF